VIAGTPAAGSHGTYNPQVIVRDSSNAVGAEGLALTIQAGSASLLTIAGPTSLPVGTEGMAYQTITYSATGGVPPYTWTATGLPSGLSMSSGGLLSGTPAVGSHGSYYFAVTVRDSAGSSATANFAFTVQAAPLAITGPSSLPGGIEGVVYGPAAYTASGGSGGYTWSATGLPGGLSMSAAGLLSGIPNNGSHGSYTVLVSVRDSSNTIASATWSLTIQAATLQPTGPTTLPAGTEGVSYGPVTLTATGGTGGYTWSATGLPSGLTLSTAGVIAGTPAAGSHGTYNPQVTVRDSSNAVGAEGLVLTIQAGSASLLTIAGPTSLPVGSEGVPYLTITYSATGGVPPYTWTATDLPSGLSMSRGGLLSGTPAIGSHGSYFVQATVRDSANNAAALGLMLTITSVTFTGPYSLAPATEGVAYPPTTLTASGGTGSYTWSATGLPNGLALSTAGVFSGTPAVGSHGFYYFGVTVRDSAGASATVNFAFTVQAAALAITYPSSIPTGTETQTNYTIQFQAAGGTGPYTWTAAGLPSGLSMSSAGFLSGIPALGSHGSYTVQVTVRDSVNGTASVSLALTIQTASPPTIVGPTSLPVGTEGVPYLTITYSATGGTGGFTWTATGLPNGLSMSAGGLLSGTPAIGSHGSYTVQATVHDSAGSTASLSLPLTITNITFTGPYVLAPATEGVAYPPTTLTASGGTGSYTWSATGLPNGLALSAAGVFSGTPAAGSHGSYYLGVTVRDSAGSSATVNFAFTVQAAASSALTISAPSALPGGIEGLVYGPAAFTATGGTGGYTWSATGLPGGLSMSAAGLLSGIPNNGSHGSYAVQVTVRDSSNASASASLPLTIQAATLQPTGPTTLPAGTEGVSYGPVTLTATGGTGGYTWSATGLPRGLTLSTTGVIAGTPAAGSHGTYNPQVIVRDSSNAVGAEGLLLTIQAAPAPTIVGPTSLPVGTEGVPYLTITYSATGGAGGYTWTAAGLPSGLSMSLGGLLLGTPVIGSHGSYTVQATVHDSAGSTASLSLPLTITNITFTGPYALAPATEGVAYPPTTLTASGGTGSYTWSATGLPNGLALSAAGVFSGTPAAGSHGSYYFGVTVRDSAGSSATVNFAFTVQAAAPSRLAISAPSALAAGRETLVYAPVTFAAAGGSGGYAWTASGLPSGLSMSSGGTLSGTPAAGSHGTYTVQVKVQDSSLDAATASLPLLVYAYPPLLGFAPPFPSGQVGVPYSFTLTAAGGMAPYTWTPQNALPAGLTLTSSGLLSGTPAVAGHYTIAFMLLDAQNYGLGTGVDLTISAGAAPLTISTPVSFPDGTEQASYSGVSFSATGGSGGYTWSAGGLPSGLSILTASTGAGTGTVSGVPASGSHGTYSVQVTVKDSNGATASCTLPLTILSPQTLTITEPSALGPYTETAHAPPVTFMANGGTAPYTWSATGLPPGVTFSAGGSIGGTPPAGSRGAYSVTATVQDANAKTASRVYSLTVNQPPQIAAPTSLAAGTAGAAYGPVAFTATGGSGGNMWSATGLPQGLSLTINGLLSGVPASGGNYSVTVRVTDIMGVIGTAQFSLTIGVAQAPSTLTMSCTGGPGPGQVGVAFSIVCTADGGTPPYSLSLAGTLPAGLNFNTRTGAVLGTPLAAGPYSFSIAASDAGTPQQTVSQTFGGTMQPAAFSVTPGSLAFSYQPGSTPLPQSVSISPGGLAFQVTTGSNCSWLQASPQNGASPAQIAVSVNPAGLLSGNYNCSLSVAAGGGSQSLFVTLQVAGATLTASPGSLTFSAQVGGLTPTAQTMTLSAGGGAAVPFSVASTCNWFTVAQSSAVTPSTLTVSIQPAGLAPSTYTCPILITAPSGAGVPQPTVTLQLNPAALTASVLSVSLTATQGGTTPVGGSLSLTGPGTPVPFTISVSGGAWISASQTAPATPATIDFQADPTGLAAGTYAATIHVTSAGGDLPITVTFVVTPVTARVVPPSLSFRFRQGSLPVPQVVSVLTSNGSALPFTFQTTPQLTATAGPGAGNLTVAVAPGIAAGTYTDASVTLLATGSSGWQQVVPVTVIVDPAPATPVLTVSGTSLAFSLVQGAPPATQLLVAGNQGAAWSPAASASTTSGGAWLGLSSLPATAADGAPVPISVTADLSQLSASAAGVYFGEVVVTNPDTQQAVRVPVSLTVNPLPSILLSRSGLSFEAIQGGAGVPGDTVDLLNLGLEDLSFTAAATTLSGGNWLRVTPASGAAAGGAVAGMGVSVDTAVLATLAPGTYYGSVVVSASDAASGLGAVNSPQTASVTLNLLAPARQLGPSVRPGALIFNPGAPAQTVTLYNPNSAAVGYTAAAVTDDGNLWCTALPATGEVQGSAPLTVQVGFAALGAGVHTCTVQLSFSDGSSQTVSALAVVAPGAGGAAAQAATPAAAGGCTPSGLVVAMSEPSQRAAIPAFQAVSLEVQVLDTCGNPVDDAATSILFSNADGALTAHAVGNGLYRSDWTPMALPRNVPETDVSIQAVAQTSTGQQVLSGSAQPVPVSVLLNSQNPVLIQPGGIVDSASLLGGGRVAPCGWLTVFGQNMAGGTELAAGAPLPVGLQGAGVFLGGLPLPLLYVSPGQINAQVPCGIPANSEQNLVVVNGAAQSPTVNVVVAGAQPAVFTMSQQGSGQSAAFWTTPGGDYVLADSSNPVPAGGVIEIYCTGLGAVTPAVPEGTLSPAVPLSWTAQPVSVTIGGVPADTIFSGLTPGGIGLYQVNVTVPAGAPTGTGVPLIVSVDGYASQPGVTIAVK
jgi:uncharacterized protein (TIGR03437 family)